MAVVYGSAVPPGLLVPQYPPPLLPKPGKDNVRLQKLLKRTAKKKSPTQTSQSAVPFRSSLSPVNEASPDLERSDNSTPPKTPETPFTLHSIQPAPRFTVRPLYQHVASPYPQRAAYGRPASMSPQVVATPSYSYMQDVTTSSSLSVSVPLSGGSPALGQVEQPNVPRRVPLEAAVVPAPELQKQASSTLFEFPAGRSTQSKPQSPGPTLYLTAGAQALFRPLTVLAPIVKSKSPRPTFKATEPSRSPKPMFDVPQIRMYTASTSYYEMSRTPPVYDTATLTAIGSMVLHSKTPAETKQDEVGRVTTSTSFVSVTDPQRKAPTSDATTGTSPKVESTVPTLETPTSEVRRATPMPDTKMETPTSENKRATPTADSRRATPTSDVKTTAPLSVIRVKTPTYEFEMSRIIAGRPRTPARAATPAFEVSRPNPLLFAVTPITVEPERSSTSQTLSPANSLSVSQSVKITEAPEALLNGDIHSDMTHAAKPVAQSLVKPKPESDLTREVTRAAPVSSQRPKTPTYEASRLLSTSPGYKRPKTPTYRMPRSGVSPVAFQRPKTPTQMTQKSSYRGLTPAEYAAFGGIKTHSPAFGIGSTMMATQEEVKPSAESKTPSQGPSVTGQSTEEGAQTKDMGKPQQVDKKAAPIPAIVVSHASESSGKIVTKETISYQVAARQGTISTEETPTAKSQITAAVETKPKAPETKQPLSKAGEPLKAEKKLLGKVQTTEQPQKESKSEVLKQKERAAAMTTKDSSAAPRVPAKTKPADGTAEDKGKDQAAGAASSVKSASDKKEVEDAQPAELLLKVLQKPKGIKAKTSGWSRLKKHMVVEQEEPKFPEMEPQWQAGEQRKSEEKRQEEASGEKAGTQDDRQTSGSPKATKMWDAVLFQMFSSKENIMHQIELSKSETEQSEDLTADESKEIPSFAHRLPVLLFSPKFDAKKLREAASRPVTKISTVFEMGLIGRKGKEEEPKDFNRTARGFRNV